MLLPIIRQIFNIAASIFFLIELVIAKGLPVKHQNLDHFVKLKCLHFIQQQLQVLQQIKMLYIFEIVRSFAIKTLNISREKTLNIIMIYICLHTTLIFCKKKLQNHLFLSIISDISQFFTYDSSESFQRFIVNIDLINLVKILQKKVVR